MSGTEPERPPFERFQQQLWDDWAAEGVQPLHTYLGLFPGADEKIARAYLEHPGDPPASGGEVGGEEYFGPYRIVREIGRGGQAIVYEAEETHLGRLVALKVLREFGQVSEHMLTRFRREAKVVAGLDHPAICAVHDAGVVSGVPYIAMRVVKGETLAQRISRVASGVDADLTTEFWTAVEPITPPRQVAPPSDVSGPETRSDIMGSISFLEKVARALHVAHEAGIVHRDIKPGNLMVTPDEEPVILDFGLAHIERAEESLTQSGDVLGTPAYMSPEQLQGMAVDRRTDVWSVGVALYEVATWRRPFQAPTQQGMYHVISTQDPPNPRLLNPNLHRDLATVIETALQKDRARRYQTALDLAEDLRRVRERETIAARPATRLTKLTRWAQRNQALACSLGAATVFLVVGLVVSLTLLGQRTSALASEQSAVRERTSALAKYQQISDPALMRHLMAQVEGLWPRREEKVEDMDIWLSQAGALNARLTSLDSDLAALRRRALPLTQEDRALEPALRQDRYPELFERIMRIEAALKSLDEKLAKMATGREELEKKRDRGRDALEEHRNDPRLRERMIYTFGDRGEERLHRSLATAERERPEFLQLIAEIKERREFALTIRQRSVGDHREAWGRCCKAVNTDRRFTGIVLRPQVGLVPLGRDRDSGFFEFWQLGSGAPPEWGGTFLAGQVKIDEGSAIVLVLLPGGEFSMGAQGGKDAETPNLDPAARSDESPVRNVGLMPFFMGKHEVTQGQWSRLMKSNPSYYLSGGDAAGETMTLQNPVENLTWNEARSFLGRLNLVLPTEAQWEYAARGGTRTPWWTGAKKASLNGKVNLADTVGGRGGIPAFERDLTDGHLVHAPAGDFGANLFGLHEVLGNVWEWCRDRYGSYDLTPQAGDGLRRVVGARDRVYRGGGFVNPAVLCRSAYRGATPPDLRLNCLGLRPAKRVEE